MPASNVDLEKIEAVTILMREVVTAANKLQVAMAGLSNPELSLAGACVVGIYTPLIEQDYYLMMGNNIILPATIDALIANFRREQQNRIAVEAALRKPLGGLIDPKKIN